VSSHFIPLVLKSSIYEFLRTHQVFFNYNMIYYFFKNISTDYPALYKFGIFTGGFAYKCFSV